MCVCAQEQNVCPLSVLTSQSPGVNVVHYNIHEAAGLLSGVKAKPDITELTSALCPQGTESKKGTDEPQLEGMGMRWGWGL